MTPRQARLIRDSFDYLREMTGPLSMLFYGRLFNLDPSLRPLFHSDMRLQGQKLMAMLATVVDSADNVAAVRPALRELGRRHLEYGANADHYETVASALVWALGQALEREFHPEVKAAWSELVREVNEEMKRGAADA